MSARRFILLLMLFSMTSSVAADRFAILIGVGDYDNLPDLRYPHADVSALGRTLTDYGGFPAGQIFTLRGSEATYTNIRSAVLDWLGKEQRVTPTDLVLFYFSGYGAIEAEAENQPVQRFLLPWGAKRGNPSTYLNNEELASWFRQVPAQWLVLLDAGFQRGGKSITSERSKGLVIPTLQMEDALFATSTATITASQDDEAAHEDDRLQHGVLTHHLIQGIQKSKLTDLNKDERLSVEEIYRYLEQRVTGQHPQHKGSSDVIVISELTQPAVPAETLEAEEAAEPYGTLVRALIKGAITEGFTPESTVAVYNFPYQNSRTATGFSRYLQQEIERKLRAELAFALLDQETWQSRYRNKSLEFSGAKAPSSPAGVGEIIGSDGVISGSYWVDNEYVEIRAKLTSSRADRSLAEKTVRVPKSRIPIHLRGQLVPPQPTSIAAPMSQTSPVTTNTDTDLRIDVWTGRGDGGIYYGGEKMVVFLRSNRDCYVHLVYADAAEQNIRIFPNAYSEANRRIDANTVYRIPTTTDAFEFVIRPPFGREELYAFASTAPLPHVPGRDAGKGLILLDGSRQEIAGRYRSVRAEAPQQANVVEASCIVTTMSRK
ncbi:MAG: caspase family protein [Candidatus Poribacteria bacterium]|nr:caspase family protein [Candidatus Poribacteria bacterium]